MSNPWAQPDPTRPIWVGLGRVGFMWWVGLNFFWPTMVGWVKKSPKPDPTWPIHTPIIHYRPLSILPTRHNATVNMLGLLSYIFPFGKFFFFFNWHRTSPKQDFLDSFLESKLWIYVPTHQSRVSSNSKELFVNIEPKMSGSIAHPKLPTT